ncbi:isochorismate synthase [Flavobacterium sp. SUN046]|uniref:isochorismate synthase n=1 Tax=Flavobacterium sp. SUN046 TaxID=3002440 RepID=UPI002DB6DAC0|nr:isochorismate synthase [Flavobacterium sp. SUN046]MEC4050614.1 isochorismate synthase [Flavobacterium sp. SUN046]
MTTLFQKQADHLRRELPFVLFCKPNSKQLIGVFQQDDTLYSISDFTENGFAFVSFDSAKKYLIPQELSDVYVERIDSEEYHYLSDLDLQFSDEAKSAFEDLVVKGVKAITEGSFEKLVVSRKEILLLPSFEVESTFRKFIQNYPTAFKYCWYHPKVGFWMGATPEQFVKTNGNTIATVALAGTQLYNEPVVWESKEQQEQVFVTDYIVENLKNFSNDIKVSAPYTFQAGSICHIKTDIKAMLNNTADFANCIEHLHPTPAVCGLPKEAARQFIINEEGYDRSMYAGFLGELNIDFVTFKRETSDLFVNLRCMEMEGYQANLYIGCGITKDSDPEKEFLETVNKSMTIKRCIL